MEPATILILLLTISSTISQNATVVNTTLGSIQGTRTTVEGKEVDVYYGIPFAKPPVGELRFRRPVPAEPWTDVRATVTKPNACFQTIDTVFGNFSGAQMWNPNTPMSEDCLYLNVWVPRAFGNSPPNTTLVWIYGGGFYSGSSALDVYDGSKLAVSQNVIVASMNYRVGPLGFLCTGTLDAPGNQGLLDQALALKWIYDNVARFGGQQNSITIFGESAGSISVGLHLLSPVSMNYFTRAIMQSGAPLADFAIHSQSMAKQRAQTLSTKLACPKEPAFSLIQCLQKVSAEKITLTQWALVTSENYIELPTTVVVDGHFLTEHPRSVLATGTVKDAELLLGSNKDEGMYFLVYASSSLFPITGNVTINETQFEKLTQALNGGNSEKVYKATMYEYVDRVVPSLRDSHRDIADDIVGDDHFICPVVDFADLYASRKGKRSVYMYSFQHRLSNNPWPVWSGVMHGYEIEAVFGLPRDFNYTQEELALADRMMGYWTRFAQTGNPRASMHNEVWPQLTRQEAQYLKITGQGDTVGQGLRRDPCTFRSTVLPLLECPSPGKGNTTTLSPSVFFTALCAVCIVFFFMRRM
ncbi:hypothetical protein ACOMHN_024758 [Nucella lapillus]